MSRIQQKSHFTKEKGVRSIAEQMNNRIILF